MCLTNNSMELLVGIRTKHKRSSTLLRYTPRVIKSIDKYCKNAGFGYTGYINK